jgi:hypothetical protein
VAFLGVLALILLFAGAVTAGAINGLRGAATDHPAQGQAYGLEKQAEQQQKHAEQQQKHAERRAEQLKRMEQRRERQRELKEQRQSGAEGPQIAEALTEQAGTIATQTDIDGTTVYVLQTAGGTLALDVGPPRFWGDSHPLAPFVGQTATVTGVQKAGSDRLAVYTVGDAVIRAPGRPPWAGGWKPDGQTAPVSSPSPSPTPIAAP